MSYHHGLNGNDIDWEYAPTDYMCIECSKSAQEITNNIYVANQIIDTLNSTYDLGFEEISLEQTLQKFYDESSCDMHHHLYYELKDGIGTIATDDVYTSRWKNLVKYAIILDCNDNWVDTWGEVPDDVFTEEYIKDKREVEGEN